MTLSKNGKRLGRPRGSKTKPKVESVKKEDRLSAVKTLRNEYAVLQRSYEALDQSYARDMYQAANRIRELSKELNDAKVVALDAFAVIKYLEKKLRDFIVKDEEK